MSDAPVVVVGGGLAGLATALELADAGRRVTLLEGRPRLGGATWSFERHGRWFDNGQHVFLRCCTAYLAFLRRIGADGLVHLQDRLDLAVVAPGGRMTRLRRDGLPAPLHLGTSLATYRHLGVADRLRLGRAALALRRLDRNDPDLDASTFGAFLRAHSQRPAAIERLWDLICVPTVNLPADEASLALAATVFQIGLLTEATQADIGWSRVPLAELHAGPARRALEQAGADVRTGSRVEEVRAAGAGAAQVVVNGALVEASAVVLAVPHDAASRLCPRGAVEGSQRWPELGSSPIVNVHLQYDRVVLPHPLAAAVDSPVQFVFDRTGSSGFEGPGQCLAVSLSAADRWLATPSAELIDTIDRELRRLFPAAADAVRIDGLVTREPEATFRGGPGTASLRPGPRAAVPWLYLAGAWTDTGWPATMEGAVRSGVAAAGALLADHARQTSTEEAFT